jgi:hypothetical protein
MKFRLLTRSFVLASALSVSFGCSDDPKPGNEEELITFVQLTFSQPGAEPHVFTWSDPDGEIGSGAPIIDDITLKANSDYDLSLSLADHSSGTPEDITAEISDEAEDHQFFFLADANLDAIVTFEYDDEDANGNPIGLNDLVHTTNTGSGKLKLILRHKPKKSGDGVSEGDITHAGGDTDIEVEFDVTVEE